VLSIRACLVFVCAACSGNGGAAPPLASIPAGHYRSRGPPVLRRVIADADVADQKRSQRRLTEPPAWRFPRTVKPMQACTTIGGLSTLTMARCSTPTLSAKSTFNSRIRSRGGDSGRSSSATGLPGALRSRRRIDARRSNTITVKALSLAGNGHGVYAK